ncbi:MAG TPA: LptE family protein [Methylomirabilota bacterium]|nr:LptE family protein [Methylomirabilota bacterium]
MRPIGLRAVAVLAGLAALQACGYSFHGTLPEHIKTVAVPMFVNRTQQPAVESVITRAIVDAFATNGRLRVVRREEADSILEGEVTSYSVGPIAVNPSLVVQQYRLGVTLNLRMRDVRRNEVLFQQNNVSEQADFAVAGDVAQTLSVEAGALQQAATEIARSIVSLAIDRF